VKWYVYYQNNSGGSFTHDAGRGIGIEVAIEAPTGRVADARAEDIGLYFDGAGDCSCCGDRWISKEACWTEEDAEADGYYILDTAPVKGTDLSGWWAIPSYAHPYNGPFYQCNAL